MITNKGTFISQHTHAYTHTYTHMQTHFSYTNEELNIENARNIYTKILMPNIVKYWIGKLFNF